MTSATALLHEIQELCANAEASLATALRKSLILATRLKQEPLREWVHNELSGYPEDSHLPAFRVLEVEPEGRFHRMWSTPATVRLPLRIFPESWQAAMGTVAVRDGLGKIEALVDNADGRDLIEMMATDVVGWVNSSKNFSLICTEVYKTIPINFYEGIIDSARTKLLAFSLDVEPELYRSTNVADQDVPTDTVSQLVQIHFYGDGHNVAVASHDFRMTVMSIQPGNYESFRRYLLNQGIPNEDVDDLETAIKESPTPINPDSGFGDRIATVIGRVTEKAARGAIPIGAGAAANLLSDAIKAVVL